MAFLGHYNNEMCQITGASASSDTMFRVEKNIFDAMIASARCSFGGDFNLASPGGSFSVPNEIKTKQIALRLI